ncbi:PspC domain-containing protein [Saccharomonospora glauca]|uniref:Putative stress-responsive transcriptional regulator n=1 Tax=Saccharomonospora glauca K62 TaxID=928724 RepID=I1CXR8_9PSEU|nr:PspC domain-containing protein [Saccharomonospora glauca]EIE97492.1 putative stress-responsive transcriptional regulator [Saccharomonospora glauca K62]
MNTTDSAKRIEGFEDTVKDFWVSRPRRPHHGRKLAGVASGIGYRYGIDPTVVRVAFVVLTVFGGIGLAVYLLGWLLLPGEGDEVSGIESLFGQGQSSMPKGFALALGVVLVPMWLWSFSGSWFDGGAFFGLALVVAALYLLHRSRGHLRRPTPTVPAAGTAGTTTVTGDTGVWGRPVSSAPPTWDPLGADPLGWRLPDETSPAPSPQSEPPAPPRRKSKVGIAVMGLALAVGGAGAALAAEGVPWFTPAHVVGLVLAVLGLGMVVGSFRRGGRGLVWLAVPLSLAGLVLSVVPLPHVGGGFGDLETTPASAEQVLPVYERTAGDLLIDLTRLSGTDRVTTTVRVGVGNLAVIVPPDADVRYNCEAGVGTMECLGQERTGIRIPELRGVDYGVDGEGGPRITLTAQTGAGNVEVLRG